MVMSYLARLGAKFIAHATLQHDCVFRLGPCPLVNLHVSTVIDRDVCVFFVVTSVRVSGSPCWISTLYLFGCV